MKALVHENVFSMFLLLQLCSWFSPFRRFGRRDTQNPSTSRCALPVKWGKRATCMWSNWNGDYQRSGWARPPNGRPYRIDSGPLRCTMQDKMRLYSLPVEPKLASLCPRLDIFTIIARRRKRNAENAGNGSSSTEEFFCFSFESRLFFVFVFMGLFSVSQNWITSNWILNDSSEQSLCT